MAPPRGLGCAWPQRLRHVSSAAPGLSPTHTSAPPCTLLCIGQVPRKKKSLTCGSSALVRQRRGGTSYDGLLLGWSTRSTVVSQIVFLVPMGFHAAASSLFFPRRWWSSTVGSDPGAGTLPRSMGDRRWLHLLRLRLKSLGEGASPFHGVCLLHRRCWAAARKPMAGGSRRIQGPGCVFFFV